MRMTQWFLTALIALVTGPFASVAIAQNEAYIKLQLDSSEVFSGDTIVLDVESTGLLDPIDLSVIEQQATLLRETTGTRIAVIGGKVQEIAIRRMDLLPKRTGVVVIGPLIAGDVVSNSVHIKVLDATRPDWTPLAEDAQIQTTLKPATAIVNQQVLLTIALLHRYPISSESFVLPELGGFSKRAIIENRRTIVNNVESGLPQTDAPSGTGDKWFRTEWQTLIYPRQSGTLTIDPVEWSGTLIRSNVERAQFQRATEPLQLTVTPVPADADGWWLPSRSVSLKETWSSPPTELRAGDELERTITVNATDVLAGQIPTPNFPESRALKQTLIKTRREESVSNNTVLSRADFTLRVTAQSPIPVFLDTVRMKWWDTAQQAHREAIVPARRINVGLPDRADVLKKLALEESRFGQLQHRLQSAGPVRLLSVLAGSVALLYLLWVFFSKARGTFKQGRQLRRHLAMLQRHAKNGDAMRLYDALRSAQSRKILHGGAQPLVSQLEQQLFACADNDSKIDAATLQTWLRPVVQSARHRAAPVSSSPEVLRPI
jgi:hypothetical protein